VCTAVALLPALLLPASASASAPYDYLADCAAALGEAIARLPRPSIDDAPLLGHGLALAMAMGLAQGITGTRLRGAQEAVYSIQKHIDTCMRRRVRVVAQTARGNVVTLHVSVALSALTRDSPLDDYIPFVMCHLRSPELGIVVQRVVGISCAAAAASSAASQQSVVEWPGVATV